MDRHLDVNNITYCDVLDLFKNIDEAEEIFEGISKYASLYTSIKDIPSRLFCRKIAKFFEGTISITKESRGRFISNFKNEMDKNTIRILNIIDKIEDENKIDYINNLFAALVNEDIDFAMFFRLCKCIEPCTSEDLEKTSIYVEEKIVAEHDLTSQILSQNGILSEYRSQLSDGDASGHLESLKLSKLGEHLYKYAIKNDK